jgi:acyl-coenzyme A synthetase/AMP-(fatty) acid ligase
VPKTRGAAELKLGSALLALLLSFQVDTEGGKQWRYAEIPHWTAKCGQRLREIGVVGSGSCVALVASSSPLSIFVHLACASIGSRLAPINALLSVGKILTCY